MDKGDIVSRVYSNFRGVDFRGEEINLVRSPDSLNVWKDYKETESVRTRPGMKLHESFNAPIYGVHFYKSEMLVHSGNSLFRFRNGDRDTLASDFAQAPSHSFIFGDVLYISTADNYVAYRGDHIETIEGYVPTTTNRRKPEGGGSAFEDMNMLSDYRKNSFLSDGTSKEYYLDTMSIDADFVPVVTVDGATLSADSYTVDYTEGKITFDSAPAAPLTDGQDNVLVKFKKHLPGYREKIYGCKITGSVVTVCGVVSNIAEMTSTSSGVVFASGIPEAYRPIMDQHFVCQGSGMNRWQCSVKTDGTLMLSRYGISEQGTMGANTWLPFSCTYQI